MVKRMMWLICYGLFISCITSCSKDDYDDTALWSEVDEIKSHLAKINADISALQILATALENGTQIVNVVQTSTGYELIFSDGKKVSLKNGTDGKTAPALGLKEVEDVYYWTLDGQWLKDDKGNIMPVSGTTPKLAVNEEGYWTIDDELLVDESGQGVRASGKDGDSFFSHVSEDEEHVIIALKDGTSFKLPKVIALQFELPVHSLTLAYGQKKTLTVVQSGVKYSSISKPDGWKVELSKNELHIYSPVRPNKYAEQSGQVSIVVVGSSSTLIVSIDVQADPNTSGGSAGESDWTNW